MAYDILVKTPLGMEEVAASYIEELEDGVRATAKPHGFKGIVLVEGAKDKHELAKRIKERVLEAERVIVAESCVKANIDDIVSAVVKVAEENLKPTDTFAVRTVRRGSHPYTSIDVNVRAGAAIKGSLNSQAPIESPSKIIAVGIVKDVAIIGILRGEEIWSKERPGKFSVLPFLRKAAIAHAPYLGPLDAARTMGARIGREAQAFEVKEPVVAISSGVRAEELSAFLAGYSRA